MAARKEAGVTERLLAALRIKARAAQGRAPEPGCWKRCSQSNTPSCPTGAAPRSRPHRLHLRRRRPFWRPYNLITTQTGSLQYLISGATVDTDKRATATTYDWTLRKPLTQTVDPNGLALISRASYDSGTARSPR